MDDLKSKNLEKEKIESENGKSKELSTIKDPLLLSLNLALLMDKAKIRECGNDVELVVCYILDTIFKFHKNLEPVAKDLIREAKNEPKLIIPSRKLVMH